MKMSKAMAETLLRDGKYQTRKYLYQLGVNMYGQQVVTRTPLDEDGHRAGNTYSMGLFNPDEPA